MEQTFKQLSSRTLKSEIDMPLFKDARKMTISTDAPSDIACLEELQSPMSQPTPKEIRKSKNSNQFMGGPSAPIPKWRQVGIYYLDHWICQLFFFVLTVYALFGDDTRILSFPASADDTFSDLTIATLILFGVEIILTSIFKEEYFNSFFFWLDVVSTVSLLTDIPAVWSAMVGTTGGAAQGSAIIRAGRASRAGTRAGRLVRIVRLIRLIRIAKLYKTASANADRRASQSHKITPLEFDPRSGDPMNMTETRVGKKLSDLTTRRVIILVLAMLFSVPAFDSSTFTESVQIGDSGLRDLAVFYRSADYNSFNTTYSNFVSEYSEGETPLLYLLIDNNATFFTSMNYTEERFEEIQTTFFDDNAFAVFDNSYASQLQAGLNIAKTLFTCVVLAAGAFLFSKDARELVLEPIERMIEKVKAISRNPLAAAQFGPDITKTLHGKKMSKKQQPYETAILESTLNKIGGLLALGFGEAGSAIISTNMAREGDLNPMIPGKKVWAIFGFCDIRNFTDATEVLQEGVMVFVNQIAEIVHSVVDRYGGSANKNIGDAFLLVWKLPEINSETANDPEKLAQREKARNKVADMSVIAFLKIIAKINRAPNILKYREDPALNARMPGYQVKMGFGLHVGWAIEGAIGSDFKIDASYLSPNVNMAARLEGATKQYAVPLLISQALHSILSPATRNRCRQVDCVTVKGSTMPMGLFTVDVDPGRLKIDTRVKKVETLQLALRKQKSRQRKYRIEQSLSLDSFAIHTLFDSDQDLVTMREDIPLKFYTAYNTGFNAYISGEWGIAKEHLNTALEISRGQDGPCQTLLKYLSEFNYVSPKTWKGYRELTEK
eukprot:GILK01004442.1.p1 GENE.GILK01004442.1~~GILK01004442.1.p1  ORF type:complete len:836 (-),score=113.06 GILK01004442.1:537-3044(-)